jgi:predicted nucleic acid-binding protein
VSVAYLDTSYVLAIAFGESGATTLAKRLKRFDRVVSSALLEAEYLSALARERRALELDALAYIERLAPPRSLADELRHVLRAGYVRGADAWHLATAWPIAPSPYQLSFLTCDVAQAKVATTLGFAR